MVSDEREALGDMSVEGPAGDSVMPFPGNPPETWDPKLNFGTHFQVLDDDQIWQWGLIAEGDASPGYWKWVSKVEDIDLDPLDIHVELGELRNRTIGSDRASREGFIVEVRAFYADVEERRRPIREKLVALHKGRKANWHHDAPVGPAPLLSHLESGRIRNGAIETTFQAAPLFFSVCREHSEKATDLAETSVKKEEAINNKDKIYKERAVAVVFAAACLEAYVNRIGTARHPDMWDVIERKLTVTEKLRLLFERAGKLERCAFGQFPLQSVSRIFKMRNEELMHAKARFMPVVRVNDATLTHIDSEMSREFVEALPGNVAAVVRFIGTELDENVPRWAR